MSESIVKQLVNIRLILEVEEYHADVYYNPQTGERVHAAFPPGVVNEVNKFALHLRKTDQNVSLVTVGSREFYVYRYEGALNDIPNATVITHTSRTEIDQKALKSYCF